MANLALAIVLIWSGLFTFRIPSFPSDIETNRAKNVEEVVTTINSDDNTFNVIAIWIVDQHHTFVC